MQSPSLAPKLPRGGKRMARHCHYHYYCRRLVSETSRWSLRGAGSEEAGGPCQPRPPQPPQGRGQGPSVHRGGGRLRNQVRACARLHGCGFERGVCGLSPRFRRGVHLCLIVNIWPVRDASRGSPPSRLRAGLRSAPGPSGILGSRFPAQSWCLGSRFLSMLRTGLPFGSASSAPLTAPYSFLAWNPLGASSAPPRTEALGR